MLLSTLSTCDAMRCTSSLQSKGLLLEYVIVIVISLRCVALRCSILFYHALAIATVVYDSVHCMQYAIPSFLTHLISPPHHTTPPKEGRNESDECMSSKSMSNRNTVLYCTVLYILLIVIVTVGHALGLETDMVIDTVYCLLYAVWCGTVRDRTVVLSMNESNESIHTVSSSSSYSPRVMFGWPGYVTTN